QARAHRFAIARFNDDGAAGQGRGGRLSCSPRLTAHAFWLCHSLLITTGNKGSAPAVISHSRRSVVTRVPGAAQHEVVRCRPGTVPVCGGPGSATHRFAHARAASRPGHTNPLGRAHTLFTCQTAHLVPAPHVCARGLQLCFANPNRGWAERRETFGC